MKALILAAGKGTRISHLTQHCPKPNWHTGGYARVQHERVAYAS